MKNEGQTTSGPGVVPDGPPYDRSGTKGTGQEPLRQPDGSSITTGYPTVPESRDRSTGGPGAGERGQTDRGYVPAGSDGTSTEDATVSADGRRRVRNIDG